MPLWAGTENSAILCQARSHRCLALCVSLTNKRFCVKGAINTKSQSDIDQHTVTLTEKYHYMYDCVRWCTIE